MNGRQGRGEEEGWEDSYDTLTVARTTIGLEINAQDCVLGILKGNA